MSYVESLSCTLMQWHTIDLPRCHFSRLPDTTPAILILVQVAAMLLLSEEVLLPLPLFFQLDDLLGQALGLLS